MKTSDYLLKAGITIAAAGLLLAHKMFAPLPTDNVTLVLLLFAALPWLGSVFKSVKIPNLIELELQDLRDRVDEAKGAAQSANNVATYAASGEPYKPVTDTSIAPEQRLSNLIQEYNNIRRTQTSGPLRTENMTRVVRQMSELVPKLANFDLAKTLSSSDGGTRLSAYAFLYENPSYSQLIPLVESLTQLEGTPFGQYWALKALRRVLGTRGNKPISPHAVLMLRTFRAGIKAGSDRDYELRQIFQDLDREEKNS